VKTPWKPERFGLPQLPLLLILLISSAATLHAQSNQAVDRLLDEKPASFGDAAYVILSAVGFVNENATGDEATAAVTERKLLPKTPAATDPVTLGQVCFLIMETQGLKGGLLYRLFPGPRYATRELAAQGLLKGYTHPGRVVTGEEVMWILGAVLNAKEKA
jgi:hypothetical protein